MVSARLAVPFSAYPVRERNRDRRGIPTTALPVGVAVVRNAMAFAVQ
jgi:hypothetical protein